MTESLVIPGWLRGVCDLAGRQLRILLIGEDVALAARELSGTGNTVTALASDDSAAAEAGPFCARVLTADPEQSDLTEVLRGERFDSVVVPRLEILREPAAFLSSLAPLLAPGGHIIVSVLNGAYTGVRLALLKGQLPPGAVNQSVLSLYFRPMLEELFREAELDIVSLEGCEATEITPPDGSTAALLEVFAREAESEIERFVVMGRPRMQAGFGADRLDQRLQELAADREETLARLDRISAAIDVQQEIVTGKLDAYADAIATLAAAGAATVDEVESFGRLLESVGATSGSNEEATARSERRSVREAAELERVADHLESRLQAVIRRGRGALLPEELKQIEYERLRYRLRGAARAVLPSGAVAVVISRGDEDLLAMDGIVGWHFPQTPEGVYAGHYPHDSQEAVAHLMELQGRGATCVVVPATSLWWLDHYADFREHLYAHYRPVYRDDQIGMIFASVRAA